MSSVHVMWSQPYQPLICHRNPLGQITRINPRKVYRCFECRDWRWAKNLKIRVEYDYVRIVCADGCYGERKGAE